MGAEIALYPGAGHVGRNVQVTGTGFDEWSYVAIYYDNQRVNTNPALIRTDHHGYFTASFTVPESTVGEHRLLVIDGKGNGREATFRVTPQISINRHSGVVGTEARVEGTGFEGNSIITIYYDNEKVNTNSPSITTDRYGSFTATFVAPSSVGGKHTVLATDKEDNEGQSTFSMESTPPPVPNLTSPAHGAKTTSHTPTFDWSDVTDPSGVRNTLQVANNPEFSSLLLSKEGLTQSQYTLNDDEALGRGTYYWRVKAIDGASNESSWSTTRSLAITLLPTWAFITVIVAGVVSIGGIGYYPIRRWKGANKKMEGKTCY